MTDALAAAYAYCQSLARQHYENFPVASLLMPPRMRPHIAAIYAFARTADDFADEGNRPAAERLAELDRWGARLREAVNGTSSSGGRHDQVFLALQHTIAECALPPSLFDDLLSAFRQDVTVSRYESWADLFEYCRRSANPVGRLVLRIAGYGDEDLDKASDAVCTALQLTNFWQDLAVDWQRGRLYVPAETWRAAGAREEDLNARRVTPDWRTALRAASQKTRQLFAEGRAVCDGVHGRLRWELRATWAGGTRILDKLEAVGYDVFARRPSLTLADGPALAWRVLKWTSRPEI